MLTFGVSGPRAVISTRMPSSPRTTFSRCNAACTAEPVFGVSVAAATNTNISSGVFGARVNYYPTQYSTWILQVDQTLGVTTALAPGVPQGTPSKVTTAILQTNYALSRDWWLGARVGYTQGWFFNFAPQNQGYLAGASFNYAIWRNLLLTLDYQYTQSHSNAALSSFTQNQVTAGLTYKY